jgi:hypothetical protein
MQIVIDIPEETYNEVCWRGLSLCPRDEANLVKAIRNSTPLPEHHGRLIDADAIKYTHAIARSLDDGHNWNELCVTENEIYDAPTIIEGSEAC